MYIYIYIYTHTHTYTYYQHIIMYNCIITYTYLLILYKMSFIRFNIIITMY